MTIAVVFPGQGSQSIGMLGELAQNYPEVKDTFQEASDVLAKDLWNIAQNGPEEDINATVNSQPLMLCAGVAVWRIWNNAGGARPKLLAGHSLGEYTALVCADALTFTDAVSLVAERARLMQSAVPEGEGAMAAILGLDDAIVRDVCEQAAQGQVAEAVNYNSPGQVVIAGDKNAIERAVDLAAEAGAKRALLLPVSVPSHCSLMQSAAEELVKKLADMAIESPTLPVIHNVDAGQHAEPESIREALAQQLYRPVLWTSIIRHIADDGVLKIVEMGPGRVLTGLNKRIDRSLSGLCIQDTTSLEKALGAD